MPGIALKRALAVAAPVAAAAACTALTHAYDWAVGSSPQAAGRLCDLCTGVTGLRHAPCPGGTDPGSDHTVFFAVQTINLGAKSTEWDLTNNNYFVSGMDLDCSKRLPHGAPVLCQAVPGSDWTQPLPSGIDNAFAQQVLAPLFSQDPPVDVDHAVNEWIAAGRGGFVVVLDHWNLALDDAQVGFRIVQAVGPHGGGAPRFARDELWDVYADGPDPSLPDGGVPGASSTSLATTGAYIVQGTLVADLRAVGGTQLAFGAGTAGALGKVAPYSVEVMATVTPPTSATPATLFQVSVAGVLQRDDRMAEGFAQVAAASEVDASPEASCSSSAYCPLVGALTKGIERGDDMPLESSQQGQECDGLSFGVELLATQIGGVGGYAPTTDLHSCPFSCPEGDGAALDAAEDGADGSPD